MPAVPDQRDPDPDLFFMLAPSEEVFRYALVDDATIHKKAGRRATVAGRDAFEVRIGTISWGYPPSIFKGFYAPMARPTICYW